jgi:hypothetical protein
MTKCKDMLIIDDVCPKPLSKSEEESLKVWADMLRAKHGGEMNLGCECEIHQTPYHEGHILDGFV